MRKVKKKIYPTSTATNFNGKMLILNSDLWFFSAVIPESSVLLLFFTNFGA
jgi:hypothetical protein